MDEIGTTGRSTLFNKTGKLVGFGFIDHPEKRGWKLHIVFYWVKPAKWVICMADCKVPRPEVMRTELGSLVPGEIFSQWAIRCVDGATYAQFKEMVDESFPMKTEWWIEK
jgi:hypothetical protein